MQERIGVGALSGIIGGTLSGLYLSRVWDNLPLAVLMGETANQVNWHNHLLLALIYGMLFGAIFGRLSTTLTRSLLLGPTSAILTWYGATKIDFANSLLCHITDALIGYGILGIVSSLVYFFAIKKRGLAPPFI